MRQHQHKINPDSSTKANHPNLTKYGCLQTTWTKAERQLNKTQLTSWLLPLGMSHPSTSVQEQMGSASARGWSGWSARPPKHHNPWDLLGECVIHPNSPGSHIKCYSSSQAAAESSRTDLAAFSLRVILCEMLQLNWELRHLPENPHVSSAKSGLFPSLQEVGSMFQPEDVRGPVFFLFTMTA